MTAIKPIRLRLELMEEGLSDYERRMLTRYGEARESEAIIRDVLVPSDIPLHNLHYMIQRLFGWQNNHLRQFNLPADIYEILTNKTVKGWSDLVGVLFQPPSQAEHDLFWDDDYQSGSFRAWLRKRYTGPYVYGGELEHPEAAKRDVQNLLKHFSMIDVNESFRDFLAREDQSELEPKTVKRAPLVELTLEEMDASIYLPGGTEALLERLLVDDVLAYHDEQIDETSLFPVTNELNYRYDYGDDWKIIITKHDNYDDLLGDNLVDKMEISEAEQRVAEKHQPVCIYKEGMSVLDDVGGLSGFANFLGTIYEEEDKDEAADMRRWAKSFGWNAAKTSPKSLL